MADGRASARGRPAGDARSASFGKPLLSLALAEMMEEVRALAGGVYLLPPGGSVLEMAVMAGLPRAFAAPWERVGIGSPVPVAEAARERRFVWVGGDEDMARRFPRVAVVLPYPFALAAVPLATASAVYGAVFVTWPGSHPPELSDQEREKLVTACDRLALRLERAAAERRPLEPEADLLAISPEVPSAETFGTVEAARMVSRLPYGLCSLDLHGRVVFVNTAASDLLGVPAGALLGARLWVAVPWLDDPVYEDRYRAALFSLHVTSFVALRPPGDWLSFRLYPSHTGLSVRITRARAVSELDRAGHRPGGASSLVTISQVLSLAGALTEAASVQDVIRLAADEIMPAVGCQTLVMLGSEGGRMHVVGHRGFADPRLVERFDGLPLTAQTPGTQVLTTGVPAFFESREQVDRLYPAVRDVPGPMAAWAYLPLIASGRPVGTCVLGYAERHAFPADERAVLTSLGGLIAQALERALLYDAKHRVAHGLQAALLPASLPALPGFEAAARYLPATQGMEIGGDFYDLVRSHGRASAVIGDVQGHNVTAAGLMGQIRTAVRAYTTVGQAPEEVMSSTNRLLIDLGTELFASCLYLRLDPGTGRAVMARAGHPQPLLRAPDGQVQVLDLAGGPLLGIDASATYPTTEVELEPGSVLALYTDGLIESPGADMDETLAALGRRLAGTGDRPLDELADGLVEFGAGVTERVDDIALLLLRARATD
ncbi:SpoIIE family protein phosphatase [Streptomyces graminilatus]|uniref:SpoIIE family protein phosphatase n=1 Tax=Streptomyces graminilatus TaxID=1464070 RepID=UPI0006E247F2|nr:SpoIIE family protein phosphatase [Streptomyces graminilatus]